MLTAASDAVGRAAAVEVDGRVRVSAALGHGAGQSCWVVPAQLKHDRLLVGVAEAEPPVELVVVHHRVGRDLRAYVCSSSGSKTRQELIQKWWRSE